MVVASRWPSGLNVARVTGADCRVPDEWLPQPLSRTSIKEANGPVVSGRRNSSPVGADRDGADSPPVAGGDRGEHPSIGERQQADDPVHARQSRGSFRRA